MSNVQVWLEKIKSAASGVEVFQIVDEFRAGDWTDDERALMSRTYIAMLSKLDAAGPAQEVKAGTKTKEKAAPQVVEVEEAQETAAETDEAVDQEVWYEKM